MGMVIGSHLCPATIAGTRSNANIAGNIVIPAQTSTTDQHGTDDQTKLASRSVGQMQETNGPSLLPLPSAGTTKPPADYT
ncbi:Hypothetical protein NTJ_05173 [Nesidiocoris tenuis]|uniref:Uncharacterized protein n=1 Tax=Nesidiocoris tenuis TaxID=355587 RepID=A0ABN7AJF1_9HEMI|nr:Hypothetical protein NTJ_05173 [Nesidiocoris tenuis]